MKDYTILGEDELDAGEDILFLFYGDLWRPALDRIHHKSDGHLLTLKHQGRRFKIYRKIHNG